MATINLGRVGYVHKGAYNPATTYQKYDVVLYNHGSYLYKGDSASSGHAPTDTAYWQAMLDPGEMNAATEAAVHAAEAAHASALELAGQVDRLTTPFSVTGDMASCLPVSDYPLGVISHIEPKQSGSGDPSPSNVRPITGWTGASLTRTGKNLLPVNHINTNQHTAGVVEMAHLPAGNYMLSADVTKYPGDSATHTRMSCNVIYTDGHTEAFSTKYDTSNAENDGVTRRKQCLVSIRADKRVQNIVFYLLDFSVAGSARNAKAENAQLEQGNVATSFEPYQGNQFTAPFGQTVYGGVLDWKKGRLTITHALLTLKGTEGCTKTGSYQFAVSTPGGLNKAHTIADAVCSHVKYSADSYGNGIYDGFCTTNAHAYLRVPFIAEDTTDAFESYLAAQYAAGTPVQICYTIAEPYSIQLTPQQILSLKGVNNLWSDTGKTTVNGPNSPQVMENRIAALEAAVANLS